MRRRALATIGLALILLATQGCAAFDAFFLNLLITAGRVPPAGQPAPCTTDVREVRIGQCGAIDNACAIDRVFVRGDSFAFDDPPEWLSVQTTVLGDTVFRDICVAADGPPIVGTFDFTYVGFRQQAGQLILRTVPELEFVEVSATPQSVAVGQSVQLDVVQITGGGLPLRFAWTQLVPGTIVTTFDDPTRRDPIATVVAPPPNGIVTFRVTVTDTAGQMLTADVTITVTGGAPLQVVVTAMPSTIVRGQSSALHASVQGGTAPYRFTWSPFGDLEPFPSFQADEVATPSSTTTYEVTVRDSQSATATARVTVTVSEPTPTGADLVVSVTDSPDPVTVNRLLTYTVTVTNNGPEPATGVVLSVTAPTQAERGPLTPSQGSCSLSGQSFTCMLGTIASGASVTATIPMFPFTVGTISLSATATAMESDPDPANNSATQSTTVLPPS